MKPLIFPDPAAHGAVALPASAWREATPVGREHTAEWVPPAPPWPDPRPDRDAPERDRGFLQVAVAHSRIGLWAFDVPVRVGGHFSDEYLQILGYGPAERAQFERGWMPLIHPEDRAAFLARQRDMWAGRISEFTHVMRRMHRDGHYIWLKSVGRRTGEPREGEPAHFVGTLEDISEVKRIEQALDERARMLEETERLAGVGSWEWLLEGDRVRWSPQMYRNYGLPVGSPVSVGMRSRRHTPESARALDEVIDHALQTGQGWTLECQTVRADGSQGWAIAMGEAIVDGRGRVVGLRGTNQDITERKLAEIALREARDQLRELWNHAASQMYGYRKRLAADIHDQLGQMLTAMKLELASLPGHPQLALPLSRMRALVDETLEIARNVVEKLRPPALDGGIVAALEWLAQDFSLRNEIACRVDAPESAPLPEAVVIEMFRVVQESLTNVARHAHASAVTLGLARDPAYWTLTVADDGVGFDAGRRPPSGHFGLLGMQERALRIGAHLRIDSQPGQGTRIVLRLPHLLGDAS